MMKLESIMYCDNIKEIDSDKKIVKLKKGARIESSDSFMEVRATGKTPLYVLTFRTLGYELACDEFTTWGDIIIPNNHDHKMTHLTLINKRTGECLRNVTRVQFGLGKCAVTALDENGVEETRFIEKNGTLSKGVLGTGGFEQVKDAEGKDKVQFKDMNGNTSDHTFETFDGKILAGETVRDEFLHWASQDLESDPKNFRNVCYDDFGRAIDTTSPFERGCAEKLHSLVKDEKIKISAVGQRISQQKYLLDAQFYNSLLKILRDRAHKAIDKVNETNRDGTFSSGEAYIKIEEIERKTNNTIKELHDLRKELVQQYADSVVQEA